MTAVGNSGRLSTRRSKPVATMGNPSCEEDRPRSGASSAADQRITLLAPAAHAAAHRQHVGVTHLPQVVGSEGRAEAAAAVQDDLGADVGDALLDVAFEDALAEVDRPRQVVPGVLALLADVDKAELLAAI